MTTDRYSGPIGRRQQCEANGARSRLERITFLGERQDIFDPVAAVPIAGTSHLQLLSVLEWPDRVGVVIEWSEPRSTLGTRTACLSPAIRAPASLPNRDAAGR